MQHTRGATPRHFQFDSSGKTSLFFWDFLFERTHVFGINWSTRKNQRLRRNQWYINTCVYSLQDKFDWNCQRNPWRKKSLIALFFFIVDLYIKTFNRTYETSSKHLVTPLVGTGFNDFELWGNQLVLQQCVVGADAVHQQCLDWRIHIHSVFIIKSSET